MKIIINGLTNSTGWNLGRKKRLSHLLEPFTSAPAIGTKNNRNKKKKKKIDWKSEKVFLI